VISEVAKETRDIWWSCSCRLICRSFLAHHFFCSHCLSMYYSFQDQG